MNNFLFFQNFANRELIDFLSAVFNSEHFKNLKVNDYATFCTACKTADYKPSNFQSKFVPAIERVCLQNLTYNKQIDLALNLDGLGIHHENFIKYLLNSAEIQFLYKDDDRLKKINEANSMCRNDEATQTEDNTSLNEYQTWLMTDLEQMNGIKKVVQNVTVNKQLTIPLVMKVDFKRGEFLDIKDKRVEEILFCNENQSMYVSG